jgi:hypothetical protein
MQRGPFDKDQFRRKQAAETGFWNQLMGGRGGHSLLKEQNFKINSVTKTLTALLQKLGR